MFSTNLKCIRVTLLLIIASEVVLADFGYINTTAERYCWTCEHLGCERRSSKHARNRHSTLCPPDHKCYKKIIRKFWGHGLIWGNDYIYPLHKSCISNAEADAILANVNNTCEGPWVDEDFEIKECICDTHNCNKASLVEIQLLSVVLGSLYAFLLGGVILR